MGFLEPATFAKANSYAVPEITLRGQSVDLRQIITDRQHRRIVLDGFFQRAGYYRPFRDQIRKWLIFDESIQLPKRQVDVFVHVRRTDYVPLGWALPFSYYEEAIDRLLPPGGKLWIGTDDLNDPFFRRFRKWRPRYFVGGSWEQFVFMTLSPKLVMSQSTYSWWAAFLSDMQEVVCPNPKYGCWAECGEDDLGIRLIEPNEFTVIYCTDPYRPDLLEREYQRWRVWKDRVVSKANRALHRWPTISGKLTQPA